MTFFRNLDSKHNHFFKIIFKKYPLKDTIILLSRHFEQYKVHFSFKTNSKKSRNQSFIPSKKGLKKNQKPI